MTRAVRAAMAGAYSLVGGIGGGLALLGEWKRAFAWLAGAVLAIVLATATTPWLYLGVAFALVGAAVHAGVRAYRTTSPLRLLGTWPLTLVMVNALLFVLLERFVVDSVYVSSWSMNPSFDDGDIVLVDRLSPHWRSIERGDAIAFRFPCSRWREPEIKRVVALPGDTVELRCDTLYINGRATPRELVDAPCEYGWAPHTPNATHYTHPCSRYRERLDGHAYDIIDSPERPRGSRHASDFPEAGMSSPTCDSYDSRSATESIEPGRIVGDPATTVTCAPHLHYVVPTGEVFVLSDNRDSPGYDSRHWGGVPVDDIVGHTMFAWWHR